MKAAAIIPAAGISSRMGTDKASLAFRNGLTFARHLLREYERYGVDPLVIVVNRAFDHSSLEDLSVGCVVNDQVHLGRSYSIQLGIREIPIARHCFIQNVDNPFISQTLFEGMLSSVKPDNYVIPVCRGKGGHPVLLGSQIAAFLREGAELKDFRSTLQKFRRVEVDFPEELIHLNINTPGDYEALRRSF